MPTIPASSFQPGRMARVARCGGAITISCLLALGAGGCGGSGDREVASKAGTSGEGSVNVASVTTKVDSQTEGAAAWTKPTESDVKAAGGEEEMVRRAEAEWAKASAAGVLMDDGPCLGFIGTDWVVDIAHEPRADVDNDPANQCPEYGAEASHFVEVSPDGTAINVDGKVL